MNTALVILAVVVACAVIADYLHKRHVERTRSIDECVCGKKLTAITRHLVSDAVTQTITDDEGNRFVAGHGISAGFCSSHCPGGCDRKHKGEAS